MDAPRPLPAVIAVILLEIIAIGAIGLGGLLLVLGGQLSLGTVGGTGVTATAIASIVFGAVAIVAGVGAWRGRAWGWAAGMGVALVGLLSIAASALSGAFQAELVIGVLLFGGVLACLLMPAVRRRSGIG